jgi:hypothetical protein
MANTNKKGMNKKYLARNKLFGGGQNTPSQIDLQTLTKQDIEGLIQQGIMPEDIAKMAQELGQPIPPVIAQMIMNSQPQEQQNQPIQMLRDYKTGINSKFTSTKDAPAMMSLSNYSDYRKLEKAENKKQNTSSHNKNQYGYMFSNLVGHDIMEEMQRTQGGFLIGVNLSNLFNIFRKMIVNKEKGNTNKQLIKDPQEIFEKVGEYVNVDFEKVLENKMGYRNSNIPLLPEKELGDYSTFPEVLQESKKYADLGFNGKITPFGLLLMTRMLYKYRKDNAQWVRVATILELIYKYLANDIESRDDFFKNKKELPIIALMELEEFYNTNHLFMTQDELKEFKTTLNYYKYNPSDDIKQKIREIKTRNPPI